MLDKWAQQPVQRITYAQATKKQNDMASNVYIYDVIVTIRFVC